MPRPYARIVYKRALDTLRMNTTVAESSPRNAKLHVLFKLLKALWHQDYPEFHALVQGNHASWTLESQQLVNTLVGTCVCIHVMLCRCRLP
jgi:hypothetical protein